MQSTGTPNTQYVIHFYFKCFTYHRDTLKHFLRTILQVLLYSKIQSIALERNLAHSSYIFSIKVTVYVLFVYFSILIINN
jgi:hypothetical protein